MTPIERIVPLEYLKRLSENAAAGRFGLTFIITPELIGNLTRGEPVDIVLEPDESLPVRPYYVLLAELMTREAIARLNRGEVAEVMLGPAGQAGYILLIPSEAVQAAYESESHP